MYLVATKRPLTYHVPPAAALAVMLGGNLLGILMEWGLFGIVLIQGCANAVWAATAVGLTALRYPGLRARCTRSLRIAVAQVALAIVLVLVLDRLGAWSVAGLEVDELWALLPGGLAFGLWTLLVVIRWSRAQRPPTLAARDAVA
jgi:hypothetical protein